MIKVRLNLRKVLTIAICFVSGTTMFAQGSTKDEGVVINSVTWATRNVDIGGVFVNSIEDYGGFYQWGRGADGHENPTSGTTSILSDTDTPNHGNFILADNNWSSISWYDWKAANDPCPCGWRVPTNSEIFSLLNAQKVSSEWTEENEVAGRRFIDIDTENSIFLPAERYRSWHNGSFGNYTGYDGIQGPGSNYWSSQSDDYARSFGINKDTPTFKVGIRKANGGHIRCVKTNEVCNINTSINDISSEKRNNIIGYCNIMGQRMLKEPISGLYIILYDNGMTKKVMKYSPNKIKKEK